jgi:hypothetical protein
MGGGIRTPDPRIRNPMLYPTELRPHAGLDCKSKADLASVSRAEKRIAHLIGFCRLAGLRSLVSLLRLL